mgnify:CR=1 FL=1
MQFFQLFLNLILEKVCDLTFVIIEKVCIFLVFIIEKVCIFLVFIIEKVYLYSRNILNTDSYEKIDI